MENASPFQPALDEMVESGELLFGPLNFQKYLKQYLPEDRDKYKTTARYVSVQTLTDLDSALRRSNTMVLRTGKGRFGLVKSSSIDDFFLIDKTFDAASEVFLPSCSFSDLFSFQLLGTSIEKNAVNLAIASGLLSEALELDPGAPRIAPAAGSSVYQFDIRPHRDLPEVLWPHDGQVEIDALVLAKRQGRWVLFVLEAKTGSLSDSLAKYKLVYSALAVYGHPMVKSFAGAIDVVPVYLRAWESGDQLLFLVVECKTDEICEGRVFISDLCPSRVRLLSMPSSI